MKISFNPDNDTINNLISIADNIAEAIISVDNKDKNNYSYNSNDEENSYDLVKAFDSLGDEFDSLKSNSISHLNGMAHSLESSINSHFDSKFQPYLNYIENKSDYENIPILEIDELSFSEWYDYFSNFSCGYFQDVHLADFNYVVKELMDLYFIEESCSNETKATILNDFCLSFNESDMNKIMTNYVLSKSLHLNRNQISQVIEFLDVISDIMHKQNKTEYFLSEFISKPIMSEERGSSVFNLFNENVTYSTFYNNKVKEKKSMYDLYFNPTNSNFNPINIDKIQVSIYNLNDMHSKEYTYLLNTIRDPKNTEKIQELFEKAKLSDSDVNQKLPYNYFSNRRTLLDHFKILHFGHDVKEFEKYGTYMRLSEEIKNVIVKKEIENSFSDNETNTTIRRKRI